MGAAPEPPAPRTIAAVCAEIGDRHGFALQPWNVEWADTLVAAWNDPAIAEWNPVPPEPTIGLAQSWIWGTASQNEASVGIDVVMVEMSSGEVAGEIGLQIDPSQGVGEFGFWIASDFRGRGAAKTLCAFATDLAASLELSGLVALVDPANDVAIGLLESLAWPELPTKSERRAFAYRTP